jgi:hypothetical protein
MKLQSILGILNSACPENAKRIMHDPLDFPPLREDDPKRETTLCLIPMIFLARYSRISTRSMEEYKRERALIINEI